MKNIWWKGLDDKEATRVKDAFRSSSTILERLSKVIGEELSSEVTLARSKVNYESPSWPCLQADSIGYQRGLNYVLQLLTEESQ